MNFVKAAKCKLNQGVLNQDMTLSPPLAEIYVDDIMGAAVSKEWILKLLAAIIEPIFVVRGWPQTYVWQCPLSLGKWNELIIVPCQIILGLVIDTNEMTVRISDEYLDEVWTLINMKWNQKKRFFRVNEMQKLVGKLAPLGEAAPWIYKLMSHLYTSLAFALGKNEEFPTKSLPGFRFHCAQIEKKQFNIDYSISTEGSLLCNEAGS
jgi:hypothetical protein